MIFLLYWIIMDVAAHITAIALVMTNCDQGDNTGFAWLNPVWLYRNIKVNWFGAIFIAFLGNAVFPLIALCYWFYKLCTIGRR